jgi:hypothetical protein
MKYVLPPISIITLITGTFTNAVKALLTAGHEKEPEWVSFCEPIKAVTLPPRGHGSETGKGQRGA